jgi:Icc-related predicted phosphoesterase
VKCQKTSSKVICFSDTHGLHSLVDLPDGDIAICAGDFTLNGTEQQIIAFLEWYQSKPHKHKLLIAGNHDLLFENFEPIAKELLKRYAPDVIYLRDEGTEINGFKFWGTPVTPAFGGWAFNIERGQAIKEYWNKIPADTQVLITHGPPIAILDYTAWGNLAGCQDLRETIEDRLHDLRLHVFGHIHPPGGRVETVGFTRFVNASQTAIIHDEYSLTNSPVTVYL